MQSFITTILYLLSIFIPLSFTIVNSELFEFPKFIILLSGTLLISLAWLYESFVTKKVFEFKLNKISISILAILATQLIATIMSIHPYTSFWGYYSRFHGGLLTTICYTIIYFASLKWMDTKSTQKLINISIYTAIVVGLYAILERLGIDKNFWVQDVQSRPFSTIGQPNWLAAYMIPNVFLSLYYTQISAKKSFYYFATFITITAIFLTRSRSGIIALILSLLTYYPLLAYQVGLVSIKRQFYATFFITLAIAAILGTPFTRSIGSYLVAPKVEKVIAPSGTSLDTGGTESGDIRKIVWSGALNLIYKDPIIGTGPETFAYTYYWLRPLAHNMTSEWDFLYNKAHNEYLNIASGAGIVGLLAYLYFHFVVFATGFTQVPKSKKVNQDELMQRRMFYPLLSAAIVGFAVTNFFGFSVIPVYFLMMMIASLGDTIAKPVITTPQLHPGYLYLTIPFLLIYPCTIFLADTNYAKGKAYLDQANPQVAIEYLQKSLQLRYGLDLYHATLAETYAQLGRSDLALKEVEINKQLNPYHLNFYKSRAKVYLTLASIDPKYHEPAAIELQRARELAPTDPKLAYNLGLVYSRMNKLDLAEQQLTQAISMKPNYAEPYYALTLIYEQDKKVDLIPDLLKTARANLATYSGVLKEKIDKYTN